MPSLYISTFFRKRNQCVCGIKGTCVVHLFVAALFTAVADAIAFSRRTLDGNGLHQAFAIRGAVSRIYINML